MTLDISIIKVHPTEYSDTITSLNEVDSSYLIGDSANNPKYADLIPFTQKLTLQKDTFNVEKIRQDFMLPAEVESIEWRSLKRLAALSKVGEILKEIAISLRTVKASYLSSSTETAYSFYSETVANWIDDYDIQEWFSENLSANIEDAGYYRIPISVIHDFNSTFAHTGVSVPEEDGILYQEWYRE